MARPVVALVALLALSCATTPGSRPLSKALPLLLPTGADRARWERIEGDYDTTTEHVRYALFVDPALPLLYRITQFRVSRRVAGPGGNARFEDGPETVIWNETPGRRTPLRCFAEEPHRGWWTRFWASRTAWRDVPPTTVEFRNQMLRAIEIYFRVDAEGRSGPPVG